jgi:hypothetical protein
VDSVVAVDAFGVIDCSESTILILSLDDFEAISHHFEVQLHLFELGCCLPRVFLRVLLRSLIDWDGSNLPLHAIILLATIQPLLSFHLLTTGPQYNNFAQLKPTYSDPMASITVSPK